MSCAATRAFAHVEVFIQAGQVPPDLSIDPDESLLSVINPSKSMVDLEFRSELGFQGLGFRVSGFQGLGFRV